jgi:hypothetical protein
MKSTLPSRWQEILRREAADNVGTVLAQAREQPEARRLPRWTVPAAVGRCLASLLRRGRGDGLRRKGQRPVRPFHGHLHQDGGPWRERRGSRPRQQPAAASPALAPSTEPTPDGARLRPGRFKRGQRRTAPARSATRAARLSPNSGRPCPLRLHPPRRPPQRRRSSRRPCSSMSAPGSKPF